MIPDIVVLKLAVLSIAAVNSLGDMVSPCRTHLLDVDLVAFFV